jgi:hypothetical protein
MASITVQKLGSSAHLDPRTMVAVARVQAQVNRPLREMVALMVPEAWLLSPSFESVYRVRRDAQGRPLQRINDTGRTFEPDTSPIGELSWTAIYYEHVRVATLGGGSAEFHNLLDVALETSDQIAELRFGLNQCLSSRWGLLSRHGGIDIDSGYARFESRGDRLTYVDTMKSLRFTPFDDSELGVFRLLGVSAHVLNEWAPVFLENWMEELVLKGCAAKAQPSTAAHSPTA